MSRFAFRPSRTRSKIDQSTLRWGFGQPGLSAEAGDIATRFPVCHLPSIDHLLPFGKKEMLTELMTTDRFPGFSNKITNNLPLRDCRCADMRLEPQPDGAVESLSVSFGGRPKRCQKKS
jgi:hypothetical protein